MIVMATGARQNYNRLSRWYDRIAGAGEARLRREGLALLDVRRGESVLEIGCATGQALCSLARAAGDAGLAVGVDISEGMLKVGAARLGKAGLAAKGRQIQADAAALPYSQGVFDAIFMAFTLELFETSCLEQVLSECRRMLKPGGRLGVVALAEPEKTGAMVTAYAWFHLHFPQVVDCRPIPAGRLLTAAGFTLQNEARQSLWGLPVDICLARKLPIYPRTAGMKT